MIESRESQLGVVSGMLALAMVIALSVMAFRVFEPAREPPARSVDVQIIPIPDLPPPPGVIPEAQAQGS